MGGRSRFLDEQMRVVRGGGFRDQQVMLGGCHRGQDEMMLRSRSRSEEQEMRVGGRIFAGEQQMLMRGSGSSGEEMFVGRRGGDADEEMMMCTGGGLRFQMVLGSSGRGLQQMMVGGGGCLFLQQVVLRGSVSVERQGGGIVLRLGRFRGLGRCGWFGRGKPQRGSEAKHDGREREEDGEMAPLHGTITRVTPERPREKPSFSRPDGGP